MKLSLSALSVAAFTLLGTTDAALTCPSGTYTAGGQSYKTFCNYRIIPSPNHIFVGQASVSSLAACLQTCTNFSAGGKCCLHVSWDKKLKTCSMYTDVSGTKILEKKQGFTYSFVESSSYCQV